MIYPLVQGGKVSPAKIAVIECSKKITCFTIYHLRNMETKTTPHFKNENDGSFD
jgi:hypothetical protein